MGTTQTLRGVELVNAVMAHRTQSDETFSGADDVASRTLGGAPLSPALKRWLELDDDFFTLGGDQLVERLRLTEFGDEWVELFAPVSRLLSGKVVLLEGWGSDSRRFLSLGKRDAKGEPTMMTVDMDDGPFFVVNGPVDVWLAQQAGFLEDEAVYGQVPGEYEQVRQEHGALAFGGYVMFADGMLSRSLDAEDGDPAFGDEEE